MKIPDLPGVYKWTNKINGKVYIGKAVNLRLRKNGHSIKKGSGAFIKAKKKYGIENFQFSIIEMFPNRTAFIEKYIVERETFWIKVYDATNKSNGYNICSFGSSTIGVPMPPHVKEAIRKANAGRKITAETRKKNVGITNQRQAFRRNKVENGVVHQRQKNSFRCHCKKSCQNQGSKKANNLHSNFTNMPKNKGSHKTLGFLYPSSNRIIRGC